MRILALALAALTLVPASLAHAGPAPLPSPVDGCEFSAVADVTDPARWVGVVEGWVAAADLAAPGGTGAVVAVTLTCTVSVGYDAEPAVTVRASGTAAAAVPLTAFTLRQPSDDEGFQVCSRADVTGADGVTRTYEQNNQNGRWVEAPYGYCGGANCTSTDENCNATKAFVADVLDLVFVPPYETAVRHLR